MIGPSFCLAPCGVGQWRFVIIDVFGQLFISCEAKKLLNQMSIDGNWIKLNCGDGGPIRQRHPDQPARCWRVQEL